MIANIKIRCGNYFPINKLPANMHKIQMLESTNPHAKYIEL